MKEIQLTKNQMAQVDDEDYVWLSRFKWHAAQCETVGKYYARTEMFNDKGKQTAFLMHNLILGAKNIDHRDGNSLNNQKANLRRATQRDNVINRIYENTQPFGYRGVRQISKIGYAARIMSYGKYMHLGTFKSPHVAAKMYNEKAKELHGEFAVLNEIKEKAN